MLVPILLSLTPAIVSEGPPPILQPKTYTSPSGRYALLVDPSERLGSGPGRYELKHEGACVWKGELPYTYWEAVVTDEGVAAGYAYTGGWRDYRVQGDFIVSILSPEGRELVKESERRKPSHALHTAPDPKALGLFAHPELDRLVVRVAGDEGRERGESWWLYRMTSGEALGRVQPTPGFRGAESLRGSRDARAVGGTPLTIAWFLRSGSGFGACFGLLDPDGGVVWQLDLPDDYGAKGAFERLRDQGAILDTSEPRRFALWHVGSGERVEYEVLETEDRWDAVETARAPYAPPKKPQQGKAPRIALESVAAVVLGGEEEGSPGPIRDVVAFTFRDAGIEFVRAERSGTACTIVQLDEQGEALRERRFETEKRDESLVRWFPLSRGVWLVVASGFGPGAMSSAWRIEPDRDDLQVLEQLHCPMVTDVEELLDGGLVVLARHMTEYTMSDVLLGLDADGGERWRVEQSSADPTKLFSPQDVAVLSDGRIAVVETIRKQLKIFSARGEHLDTVDLAAAWGQDPHYPADLAAGPEGILLVLDPQSSEARAWRMRADGTVLGRMTPRFEDGRASDRLPYACRFAPDGRVWTKDEATFLRLAADGLVDRVLGEGASPSRLDAPGRVLIDPLGRICVQDQTDGSVHVLGADGRKLHVCSMIRRPSAGAGPTPSSLRPETASSTSPDDRATRSSTRTASAWGARRSRAAPSASIYGAAGVG